MTKRRSGSPGQRAGGTAGEGGSAAAQDESPGAEIAAGPAKPGSPENPASPAGPANAEVLKLDLPGDRRLEAGKAITLGAMARRLPQLIGRALGMAWQVDRAAVVALLVCQVVSGVLEALGLLAMTGTITAVIGSGHIAARLHQAAPSLVLLASAAGLRAVLGIAVTALSTRLAPRISREAELRLLDAATHAELAAYDHPGYNDRWDAADRGVEVSQELLNQSQSVLAAAASLVAAAAVLTTVHPVLLPLLVLASTPQAIAGVRAARLTYLASLDTMKDRRLLGILRWYLVDKQNADQIRSGTMAGFLLGKYRSAGARVDAATDRAAWRAAKMALAGSLAGGVASGAVWATLLWLIATGRVSVAAAGTATFALRSVGTGLRGVVGYGAIIFRTGMYLDDWSDFLDEAGGHRVDRGDTVPYGPAVVRTEGLGYTYPHAERPALDGVSLEVRRGEVLALVGENGSGKTTLSKLLAALYLPGSGSVTWDGADTRTLDAQAAWRRVAVVPQEYAKWPLTARENITLGQPLAGADDAVRAAALASGADDVVDALRSGLDTLLAREWWGGQELSGGQWQRVALARAFHRDAGLLVLDEPTAALDPRAEHRIFTGLRTLAADRAVVLVTHRLTNVVVADKIAVLDRGRLVQYGTFAELRDSPGLFHDLWTLQNDRETERAPTTL
ncbi:ABC transporter ATP-binding protein [Streptomyces sp. NRRL F-5123]|uniref:ABC transporter ATP-binding protein n=1 Tax=Streptomyces sp. NRRL F-5123 TaxID=1463856 RepID=UPI00099D055E|nr:ABC transporter ATP-binding protein [Streptomyces sp. NRRL F-5123]